MASTPAPTPLMKQYAEMKQKHPDAILLFRVGDFYETFCEDAIEASRILGITLTRRANGSARSVELAGFPHHALDAYLPKLVRAGKRVAICEQLEDPKTTKKLVKRGITELITPGVNTRPDTLRPGENNFLAGTAFIQKKSSQDPVVGIAFLDITTGEFLCAEVSAAEADKLLHSIRPKEVLRMNGTRALFERLLTYRTAVNELDDWVYTSDAARQRLEKQFGTSGLKGFGVDHLEGAVIAAGSLLHYLDLTVNPNLKHITSLGLLNTGTFMSIDPFTQRNLEIIYPLDKNGKSLFSILCHTRTPMGERLLQRWLAMPLLDIKRIEERQDIIEALFRQSDKRRRISELLPSAGDLRRTVGRVGQLKAKPREVSLLQRGAETAVALKEILLAPSSDEDPQGNAPLSRLAEAIPDLGEVIRLLQSTLAEDAPNELDKGNVIAEGVNLELDQLRHLLHHTKETLSEMCRREAERTGISSLKILFTTVFGYSFEVKNTHKHKVPSDWIRKQTLTTAERYITPELREFEEKIKGAEERIRKLEEDLYMALLEKLTPYLAPLQQAAGVIAKTDALLSLSVAAAEGGYVRPKIDLSTIIDIQDGRHPVIEKMLPPGEPYIANSLRLDPDGTQIMMITGPNMSGKSALLRQTALIAIMAQCGSFVPASAATIGLVDKVFTRVGASDNISGGESTFMVEMTEAASILNNMGGRSLVLFDELGRGTSTYDGISIAWAVVEHIHENGRCRPRTLFATHYHELNEMEKTYRRIKNFNVSVKEIDGKVIFLRKLRPGGSEHSFGINVAKLAGMPPRTIKRATEVLHELEKGREQPGGGKKRIASSIEKRQEDVRMSLFQLDDPLLSQIREELLDLNIDCLTPIEALTKLHDLQSLLKGK